jgi:hypothetical protein
MWRKQSRALKDNGLYAPPCRRVVLGEERESRTTSLRLRALGSMQRQTSQRDPHATGPYDGQGCMGLANGIHVLGKSEFVNIFGRAA